MDRGYNQYQARAEAAEASLREIHAAVALWMESDGALDDRDLAIVVSGILEEYGLDLVAPDAFEPLANRSCLGCSCSRCS
jgi:hypothetical protein